ncbi:MAG: hypothetical protein F6K54_19440 [Okeania sp. SIO3B5]|uniref:tubulin-like doman-containing protein n=1 Tax=Okeania sp. SIO3B5 TaxID=2607811 RepID=UPI00140145E4|nr:tubulin-like doman-containing protein [Okeania sp. SIO3B5]NEO55057.1 hypothetical protein [Okeania sp. SIO3B5]
MPIAETERKTIVPTLVIGVGGTGLEVISRLRRLVVESYGSLENLPVLSFLHIDTDREYKIQQTRMAGPPLKDIEKYWAHVSYEEATDIVNNLNQFPWYKEWLPTELASQPGLLASVEGAKQIRGCGRFAFFFNYDGIRTATENAKSRTDFHQDLMQNQYGLRVATTLNIFIVGSISGGTGSGMLIDLGYSLRRWFAGQQIETTAIIPSPDAFSIAGEKSRVKENGYAALMELNYFSDSRTKFTYSYSRDDRMPDEIAPRTPYDFVYLVGTSNGSRVQLDINDMREMCAQNIFLDLVSNYSPYKRSLRDNIKSFVTVDDSSQGQTYPRNFMSFGLATIEIPIQPIRNFIGGRLAAELYEWWLNFHANLPPEPRKEIEDELKAIKLIGKDILKAILLAGDRQLITLAANWISELDAEVADLKLLQCTAQMPNPFAKETGKVLELIGHIQPKVEEYRTVKFADNSPDERLHGDFLKQIYDNREQLIRQGKSQLEEKVYNYLEDRNRGPKFVETMLNYIEDIFTSEINRFKREAEKTWSVTEEAGQQRYDAAIGRISQSASQWMVRKQDKIKQDYDTALSGLRLSFAACLEYKSRQVAVRVLEELQKTVESLKIRTNRWLQQISSSAEDFRKTAEEEANQASNMKIVGLNLFEDEREKSNELYEDFLASYQGIDVLARQMTARILDKSSSLWKKSRDVAAVFHLFDIEKLDVITYPKFRRFVLETTAEFIANVPEQSKIKSEMDACLRLMKQYPKKEARDAKIKLLAEKSKALVVLNRVIPSLSEPQFDYKEESLVGLVGGEDTQDEAAREQVTPLKQNFKTLAPLTPREQHKIIAVHEIGGFSLRCIEGIKQLRQSYQKWRGRKVKAEREALEGRANKTEPTVHIQEDISLFWDLMPADPEIEKLVIVAHALDILREEVYAYTGNHVICYNKSNRGDVEKVVLAANWEDAVQVLELSVSSADKQEIKRQLDGLLEKAETLEQKQQLSERLNSYLQSRLNDFRKEGGDTNPRYRREKNIIQDFMEVAKLPKPGSNGTTNQNHSTKAGIGFDVNSAEPKKSSPNVGGGTRNSTEPQATTQRKYCPNPECRKEVPLGARFCSYCGTSLS